MAQKVLRIDGSARKTGSVTRDLADKVVARLAADEVVSRDLSDGLPLLDEAWVNANFTPAADRTDAQREKLALSDRLVAELKAADTLVIGAPIYNFGLPASVKAWIDLVSRAGVTFQYSEGGPKGLLENKRAIIVTASGGTKVGSDMDFAVTHLEFVLGFLGISDVQIVKADQMALDADASLADARDQVEAIAA